MKIVIPGGSGQVGTLLARHFHGGGHEVVLLSRGALCVPWRTVAWNGETLGDWCSEIDGADVVINEREAFSGPVYLAAPEPLPNAVFMRILREACGMPLGLPAAKWMLEIGARFLRTETELILKSRRVVPGRLLDSGFAFQFPHWPEAARDLCRK